MNGNLLSLLFQGNYLKLSEYWRIIPSTSSRVIWQCGHFLRRLIVSKYVLRIYELKYLTVVFEANMDIYFFMIKSRYLRIYDLNYLYELKYLTVVFEANMDIYFFMIKSRYLFCCKNCQHWAPIWQRYGLRSLS